MRPPSGLNVYKLANFPFGLTCSLEIWMGENFLTPFTEGTSLLNNALKMKSKISHFT